ncbi:hypothetical protein [Cryptosporidium parvum Iowa II]|uniref:Uncharacterized protein n=2 Tax=Cryptosporidium parvum TaxID=5807 RepID=Q5CRE4_CRYPI|nr:hypothetical protein [Cryptosporidium parvum Iowa II]EAK88016.1 hypothetical protein cgd5_3120 [Cryptosporidium parvum Iowa II]QOY41838.1 U6 snRNA phosphodiesterase Usb1 [Cryptosporidium parvum]WKS78059.1 hypothetical protein CPCDC_5g3120 [Cryptosporidium sp. 43IA8]WRK32551.1 U6 snRNA phosphodiesterase Usb1 [Cryptosporidium parvum]|eukprot:QOY41838.1 hypothetical protein CPATCC_002439 [Cryptosporidium parvum]
MYKDEEKESKNSYHGNGESLNSDSYILKSDEIETIRSLIKGKRKELILEENDKNNNQIRPSKMKRKETHKNDLKNGSIEEITKPKIRDYFTCMLFITLKFQDIFTKKNSEIIIGELNFNELFIKFSLNILTEVYKKYYYKAEISSEKPKIYPTFDFQEIKKNPNGQKIYNNICSNSNFDLIVNDTNYQVNQRVGLHLSLTRNHHISKKLSIKFLENIIKKFNNCLDINNEIPEKAFISQRIEIQTKLKSFCILLDYDSVIILKNTYLYSKNTNINGGIFVAIQIHHSSKINYLNPIIEIIDQACIDLGIQPLYSERVFHISLFYIKKSDLYLGNAGHNSKSVIETYNFKEYLSSKLISSSINDFSTLTTKNNIVWINKLVFRVGIYEYYLLLDS